MTQPIRTRLWLPLALALSLAFACGGSEESIQKAPKNVVADFFAATRADDQAGLEALLTSKARAAMRGDSGAQFSGDQLESFEIGATALDGDQASVAATLMQGAMAQEVDVLLRQEQGDWRVYGLRMNLGEGAAFTLDLERVDDPFAALGEEIGEQIGAGLEEAFGDMADAFSQGGTAEEIAAERANFEAIAAVTAQEHEEAWKVRFAAEGRTARGVFLELLSGSSLRLDAGEFGALMTQPVDLRFEGLSRVQAVEAVAASLGLYPMWPSQDPFSWEEPENALSFARAPRPLPVAFAGPFVVEVTSLTEAAPHATGTLTLAVHALGLDPAVFAYQHQSMNLFQVEEIRDDVDRALFDEDVTFWGTPDIQAGYLRDELTLDLHHLLRGVEVIDRVAGHLNLRYPTHVEAVHWPADERGPKHLDTGVLSLVDWGPRTGFRLEGHSKDLENVEIQLSPLQADGSPLGIHYSGSDGWSGQVQANLSSPEAPAAIDLRLCTVSETSYAFTLEGLPLRRFREQPDRLELLEFEGDAPVVITHQRTLGGEGENLEVELLVENASNKDAVRVQCRFVYLGAEGEELEDFPHSLSGNYDFDTSGPLPLAAAGTAATHSTTAFFVPAGTAALRFEVTEVEFPDGTSWTREMR